MSPTFKSGRFEHPCHCGRPGLFGYGVNLRRAMAEKNVALAGRWFCEEHRPDKSQPNPEMRRDDRSNPVQGALGL